MPVSRDRLALPALDLAPRLLGAVITSTVGGAKVSVRLTEVEAYEGADDPASHAYRGRTPRTGVMFGPPGFLYTYFTYGMHWCANVVCGEDGRASAVLLRAGDVVAGIEEAHKRRPAARVDAELARGPARLATCLGLGAAHNGVDLCSPLSEVTVTSIRRRPLGDIEAGPRVGISTAQDRPWRFRVPTASSVSTFRPGGRSKPGQDRQTGSRE